MEKARHGAKLSLPRNWMDSSSSCCDSWSWKILVSPTSTNYLLKPHTNDFQIVGYCDWETSVACFKPQSLLRQIAAALPISLSSCCGVIDSDGTVLRATQAMQVKSISWSILKPLIQFDSIWFQYPIWLGANLMLSSLKGVAFPTCVSVNEIVGHFSPLPAGLSALILRWVR